MIIIMLLQLVLQLVPFRHHHHNQSSMRADPRCFLSTVTGNTDNNIYDNDNGDDDDDSSQDNDDGHLAFDQLGRFSIPPEAGFPPKGKFILKVYQVTEQQEQQEGEGQTTAGGGEKLVGTQLQITPLDGKKAFTADKCLFTISTPPQGSQQQANSKDKKQQQPMKLYFVEGPHCGPDRRTAERLQQQQERQARDRAREDNRPGGGTTTGGHYRGSSGTGNRLRRQPRDDIVLQRGRQDYDDDDYDDRKRSSRRKRSRSRDRKDDDNKGLNNKYDAGISPSSSRHHHRHHHHHRSSSRSESGGVGRGGRGGYVNNTYKMHPRNRHIKPVDYKELSIKTGCEELAQYVYHNRFGGYSINYNNRNAVKCLTKCILLHLYNIKGWTVPDGCLIPPVPTRENYVHHLADLIHPQQQQSSSKCYRDTSVKGIDVGIGGNGIYSLLGSALYGWQMIGTEVSQESIDNVQSIIDNNKDIVNITIKKQEDKMKIFEGCIDLEDTYTFSMCNPPFYENDDNNKDAMMNRNPYKDYGGSTVEMRCQGGELGFLTRSIHTRSEDNYSLSREADKMGYMLDVP
ncbi:hypothetical protein FOZ60_012204 [Perkinsus olseni]|uniref:Uncharacterized protein n=1 Tax=Perkinsus olseni TaxID=32597 RepID=A0A7J6PA58_PEROL|nr:hypothetical protein FOZ60_012204 [Perkinsus olseni]